MCFVSLSLNFVMIINTGTITHHDAADHEERWISCLELNWNDLTWILAECMIFPQYHVLSTHNISLSLSLSLSLHLSSFRAWVRQRDEQRGFIAAPGNAAETPVRQRRFWLKPWLAATRARQSVANTWERVANSKLQSPNYLFVVR